MVSYFASNDFLSLSYHETPFHDPQLMLCKVDRLNILIFILSLSMKTRNEGKVLG